MLDRDFVKTGFSAVKRIMLVVGILETVDWNVARLSRWSSQTAGGCNIGNSYLQLDVPGFRALSS